MGWEEVVKCWGLPWQKQVGSVSLEGFAPGMQAAPLLPPALPSRHQEPGGSWILSLSAEDRGEGEQASRLKMCAHGGEGHMSQEGHWGA